MSAIPFSLAPAAKSTIYRAAEVILLFIGVLMVSTIGAFIGVCLAIGE